MGTGAKIGTGSEFFGELAEKAVVGDNVRAGAGEANWVVVEEGGKIGSGSRIEPPPFGLLQNVRILAKAKVPENSVIDQAYCQRNPQICTVSEPG